MHVKDPVVHVRVWWIIETLKHPACTVSWVARLCRSWLSPRKATRISYGKKIPLGQYSCKKLKRKTHTHAADGIFPLRSRLDGVTIVSYGSQGKGRKADSPRCWPEHTCERANTKPSRSLAALCQCRWHQPGLSARGVSEEASGSPLRRAAREQQ